MSTTDLLESWGNGTSAASEISIDDALATALAGIEELQLALEAQDPGLGNYCNKINSQLRQYPELVHILTNEQRGVIVQAFCNKKFEYLDEKSKPKVKKTKSFADLPEGGKLADLL